jgi:dynein heavy chain
MMPSRGFKYTPSANMNATKLFEDQQTALGRIFAFAFVWALGGNLAHTMKDEFDTFAREKLQHICNFPSQGLVFDYTLDASKVCS